VEVEDGLLRTRGTIGMRLIPTGESRFRRAGRTDEFVVEAVPGGGLELREVVDEGDPTTFVAVTRVDPSPAELEAFAGRYRSEELDVTYTVEVVDGELVVRRPIVRDWTLAPTFADAFGVEQGGGGNLVFRRGADGAVTGFAYSSGRILDVVFERVD
jgi:hypothetical protein